MKALSSQNSFRYRNFYSPTGITRATAKKLAEYLGVDATQATHLALHELTIKLLPKYEQDDGPLAAIQVRQIKKLAPKAKKKSIFSSLLETGQSAP